MKGPEVDAVLFDLDGTLLDTAPDLVGALNHLRRAEGLSPEPVARYRHLVSRGALGLIRAGLEDRGEAVEAERRAAFLSFYREHSLVETRPFDEVPALLDALDARSCPWAIVTNKPTFLTLPILEHLGWDRRAAAVVCGDTLSVSKPDPAPVRYACEALGVPPARALMVGDDPRDLEAGRAAGTTAVLATYGYGAAEVLASEVAIAERIDTPSDLLRLLSHDSSAPSS